MAKAILVLDKMPVDCEDCQLAYRNAYAGVTCPALVKPVGDTWVSVANGERFALCPLRELPKKRDTVSFGKLGEEAEHNGISTQQQAGYNSGWNDCLKEIMEG